MSKGKRTQELTPLQQVVADAGGGDLIIEEDEFSPSGSGGNGDNTTATAKRAESKGERFARIVPGRVDKAIYAINRVGNVFNSMNYAWTVENAQAVLAALMAAVDRVANAADNRPAAQQGFKL